MINSSEFTKRLQKVIDFYDETASSFAEKIGVQRSSISHILSGRNKPSLDFVMKVLHAYPEVELYWLLNGKGNFPSQPKNSESHKQDSQAHQVPQIKTDQVHGPDSDIEHIIIFYKNGSFKRYKP
ncbi:helix-turn-helix domain-containing protein [Winogradskyella ursingii]|uniref:helix-turn-helix domain-containing protein n=1 Tax=Winogradskyella ursingii TaxID=2686079 RepID=UPI0015CB4898|nr:helix-turn-helix transcriptional regulator [Winogradskyella ursingii]